MNIDKSENCLNVITKVSEKQTSLETELNHLTKKFNTQNLEAIQDKTIRREQGLNQSLRRFNSFVRFYRDSSLAANFHIQFTDHIGCRVEKLERSVTTMRRLFGCLRKSRLRLTPH